MNQRTWTEVQRALDEEFERVALKEKADCLAEHRKEKEVKLVMEPSTVVQAIRDLLSLPPDTEIPGTQEERALLEKILCLMNFRNRKWMREIQVALPYAELVGNDIPKEAALKLRVTLDEAQDDKERIRSIELRNYFNRLVLMCVPQDERERHYDLLSAISQEKDGADGVHVPVLESGAYSVACIFQKEFYRCERQTRPEPVSVESLSDDALRERYLRTMMAYLQKVQTIPGRLCFSHAHQNNDSLFARIFVNAAFNRFLLEQWAYERRAREALSEQFEIAKALEVSAPQGLLPVLRRHQNYGVIYYPGVVREVLAAELARAGGADKVLTANVQERIKAQALAGQASALSPEFGGEHSTNEWMLTAPELSYCIWWIVLTWCYLHESALPDDDARVHSSSTKPITKRSKNVVGGQRMSSLRRMFSTLFYSGPWWPGSPLRLQCHSEHIAGIKKAVRDFVAMELKPTSLARLKSGVDEVLMTQEFVITYAVRPSHS